MSDVLIALFLAFLARNKHRTGAVCRDKTRSSATGYGACSHHGGVRRWKHS